MRIARAQQRLGAGVLVPSVVLGHLVVPTSAIRDEGNLPLDERGRRDYRVAPPLIDDATVSGTTAAGLARAVEQLRLVMGEIKIADVRAQVALSLFTDFEKFTTLKPGPHQEAAVNAMLDDLVPWGEALKILRMSRSQK